MINKISLGIIIVGLCTLAIVGWFKPIFPIHLNLYGGVEHWATWTQVYYNTPDFADIERGDIPQPPTLLTGLNPWNTTFHDLLAFNDHYVYFGNTHIPVDPSEGVIVEYSSALFHGQKAYLYPKYFYSKAQLLNNRGEVLGTFDREKGVSSRKILCDSRFPPTANSVVDTGAVSPNIPNEELETTNEE